MTEGPPSDPSGTGDIPQAIVVPKRRWAISLVWSIPIVAALLGGWLTLHYLLSKGPTITIQFENAQGLEAGKTKVRYKDVDIGTVSEIGIAEDKSHVVVTADIAKQAENLIVEGTRFWVVRPRITYTGVSGLGTLFSGAYIGVDAGRSHERQTRFTGLEKPPAVTSDSRGRLFVLRADDIGSLYIGAPVYFRRVPVGRVTGYTINDDGKGVTLDIFIDAPNDRFVTRNVRFWHASGIDASLQASGLKLDTESLISIFVGGIAFQPPPDVPLGEAAGSNAVFPLYADKSAAFKHTSGESQTYLLYFRESLRGLAPGAAVDFHGIVIGEVKSIAVEYDREAKTLRFPVEINIYPESMKSRSRSDMPQLSPLESEPRVLLDRLVARGLRAQLKSGNLLTGQLYVALDFFPQAQRAGIDWGNAPPVLPTVPGPLEDILETLHNIADKLDKVPFDTIGTNLDQTLKSLNATLQRADQAVRQIDESLVPEMRGTLQQAHKALADMERMLSPEAPTQQDLRDTVHEAGRAARALRVLAEYLSRHPEALIRGKREGD